MRKKSMSQSNISVEKYYKILILDVGNQTVRNRTLTRVQTFFWQLFPQFQEEILITLKQNQAIQEELLSNLSQEKISLNLLNISQEGLALRCYISHAIFKACRQLIADFSVNSATKERRFSPMEILPLVLNDDSRPLRQEVIAKKGFIPFSFQLLEEYLMKKPAVNLEAFVCNKTKQNPIIKENLLNWGICLKTDWGLLNEITYKKLREILTNFPHLSSNSIQYLKPTEIERAVNLLKVYHQIYREDRRLEKKFGRCFPPNEQQLQKMIDLLSQDYQLIIKMDRLMLELKAIASHLRNYLIYQKNPTLIPESDYLSNYDNFEVKNDVRIDYLQSLLSVTLNKYLDEAIDQGFEQIIKSLRPQCADLKPQIKFSFYLLICQRKTQKEVEQMLSIKQERISRHIIPRYAQHFSFTKQLTAEKIIEYLLQKCHDLKLIDDPNNLEYFDNLVNQIEIYFNLKVFLIKEAELGDTRTRTTEGLYLKRLCKYLQKYGV